jgi:hypothetical protein
MGSSEAVGTEALTIGSALAVKLDTIPGAGSTSRRGLDLLWSKENEQWSSKAKAEKTIKHLRGGKS